ncbi:MAG: alanine racemase [Holophaga sp.]
MKRSARLEVDLDLVGHNYRLVRDILAQGPPARDGRPPRLAAVLKANAYGLGALAMAEELLALGADLLAVACLPEALELRARFPAAPILVMGHTPTEYLPDCARAGLRTTLFDLPQAEALSRASVALGVRTPVHVKIDTGMNRLGLKPDAGTAGLIARMADLPGLALEGIFTQLPYWGPASERAGFELYQRVVAAAAEAGVHFPLHHVCETLGLTRDPDFRRDLVRIGSLLFGITDLPSPPETAGIRLPIALRARLSRVRPVRAGEGVSYDKSWKAPAVGGRLGTVPIGYADGYSRRLSNRGHAVVRGRRAPVAGLVTMDQAVLDLTGIPEAAEGDEVLLMGRSGDDEVDLAEVADWTGLHRLELMATIGRRVPRVYLRQGRVAGEADYLA